MKGVSMYSCMSTTELFTKTGVVLSIGTQQYKIKGSVVMILLYMGRCKNNKPRDGKSTAIAPANSKCSGEPAHPCSRLRGNVSRRPN